MSVQYPINERLIKFCEFRNIAQKDLKRILDIKSKSQISNWWNHNEEVSSGYTLKIIREFSDLNANWLIKNMGEMLLTGDNNESNKAKPYKNETELGVVNEGTDCCRRCKDLEKQIALQEELLDHYRVKKETEAHDSAQVGQYAKRNKTAGT